MVFRFGACPTGMMASTFLAFIIDNRDGPGAVVGDIELQAVRGEGHPHRVVLREDIAPKLEIWKRVRIDTVAHAGVHPDTAVVLSDELHGRRSHTYSRTASRAGDPAPAISQYP